MYKWSSGDLSGPFFHNVDLHLFCDFLLNENMRNNIADCNFHSGALCGRKTGEKGRKHAEETEWLNIRKSKHIVCCSTNGSIAKPHRGWGLGDVYVYGKLKIVISF